MLVRNMVKVNEAEFEKLVRVSTLELCLSLVAVVDQMAITKRNRLNLMVVRGCLI